MRVKFLKTVMGERTFFTENEEQDLPADRANEYVRLGWAAPLEQRPAETAISRKPMERAVRPIKGAQRGA